MKAKSSIIIFIFTSIMLSMLLLYGQDKKSPVPKKAASISEQANSKMIQSLMRRFLRANKIDSIKYIKHQKKQIEKKELKLKSREDMLNKSSGKITELLQTMQKDDQKRLDKVEKMFADFNKKIDAFEKNLKEFDEDANKKENEKLKKLVANFKEIKSKKAALIIPDMSIDLSVKVLTKLSARKAGSIMQNLPPELAAKISHRMAEEKKKKALQQKAKDILDKKEKQKK